MKSKHWYKKTAHCILSQWMEENNLTGRYVIHHRDDTPECRAYNSKETNYYRWGFDLDDTFTLGKWVVFMPLEDHIKHHNTGAKRSDEICKHISASRKGQFTEAQKNALCILNERQKGKNNPMYGKHHTEEALIKMSENHKGQASAFKGCHHSDDAKAILSEKLRAFHERMHKLFDEYKASGGTLLYRGFCKAYKSGEISLTV